MLAFESLHALAAPLPASDVDTDQIFPGRFLKTIKRYGLGGLLFHDLRFRADGSELLDFVLNRAPWRGAEILIAYENFGCGSSREHAAWALRDFGIRCVIAPSFADIFFANCFKNGILPIILPHAVCVDLMADAGLGANGKISIDLERQLVIRPDGARLPFDIDPLRKNRLLQGLDDIDETLLHTDAIANFESRRTPCPSIGRGLDGTLAQGCLQPQAPSTGGPEGPAHSSGQIRR
jgi:3-isopropylmalate/(R)-2-methylmalate dehydratase small subunit